MPLLVCDETIADEMIALRRASGCDRFDEVWEGVYVMSPMADNEHLELASELVTVLRTRFDWQGQGRTLAGANVSDRQDDWTGNYRVPDILVFSQHTQAIDRGSHWLGGPDFAIEIVSSGDRTLDKLEFYAAVKTRELLVIDRHPWKLTLFRLQSPTGKMERVAESTPDDNAPVESLVTALQFRLDANPSALTISGSSGQPIRAIPISIRDA